ncbi:hypothetical protein [Chryseobacterium luquanense]|uniref:Uncharacterized protein n=1 Tax=Chryseobacterium luquanense TaxID=2983766 RepID=A0ABT3Y4Y4_9FLAO|nr:hypothetical protein [Chryseobacterium luquanense]MCX8533061.1 hypothetical protein [Chryseobacterium luquanense]
MEEIEDDVITRVITAKEARKKSENSKGALTDHLKNITEKIISEYAKGKSKAWVGIPPNLLEETIKEELRVAGYIVKNRDGGNVLIEW